MCSPRKWVKHGLSEWYHIKILQLILPSMKEIALYSHRKRIGKRVEFDVGSIDYRGGCKRSIPHCW